MNEETRKKLERTLAQLDQGLASLLEGAQTGAFTPQQVAVELSAIAAGLADLRRTIDAASPA
jgi:hypothetical protein